MPVSPPWVTIASTESSRNGSARMPPARGVPRHGTCTSAGRGVCGISAEVAKRYFSVKFFAGNDTFTIQVGTPAWTVADKEEVGVTMRLDANPIWRATAVGFHFDDGDAGLQFTVNRAELDNFSREFRDSSQLRLQFQDNRFPQWIMGLEG